MKGANRAQQLLQIGGHDVALHHPHMLLPMQAHRQDGQQPGVYFQRQHGLGPCGQRLGQAAQAGPDFKNRVLRADAAERHQVIQQRRVA